MTTDELRRAVRSVEPTARCLSSTYERHMPTYFWIVGDSGRVLSECYRYSCKEAWMAAWEKLCKPQTQAMRKAASKEKQLKLKGT